MFKGKHYNVDIRESLAFSTDILDEHDCLLILLNVLLGM